MRLTKSIGKKISGNIPQFLPTSLKQLSLGDFLQDIGNFDSLLGKLGTNILENAKKVIAIELDEEAIKELGTIDEIVTQVAGETSLVTLVKEKAKPKRKLSGAEIALIAIGFPLWFPLALTLLILCLVFCLVFWIVGLIPLIACVSSFLVGIAEFFSYFAMIGEANSLGVLGMAMAGIGLASMLIPAVIYSVKGTIKLVKLIMTGIKKLFIRRRK